MDEKTLEALLRRVLKEELKEELKNHPRHKDLRNNFNDAVAEIIEVVDKSKADKHVVDNVEKRAENLEEEIKTYHN